MSMGFSTLTLLDLQHLRTMSISSRVTLGWRVTSNMSIQWGYHHEASRLGAHQLRVKTLAFIVTIGNWYWLNKHIGEREKHRWHTGLSCPIYLRSEKDADLGEWWPVELNARVSDKLWAVHCSKESAHPVMGTSLGGMTQLCRGGKT